MIKKEISGKKNDTTKRIAEIKPKHSKSENILKASDSELIAKAIHNMLKKDEE